ncbi:MAG TPA: bifunctional 4-hydroxy-2-oxoglutarate aldolase/2-dehydro-3-deoxy-phosphogluconate aldolase [Verrucomicrobiae bacterium]|nr:bifunctional 4-hydroxy-2-oxoglutarate aldolase/2-dehydro-3-deoxy-phosphogluconate aldolase [Verrucomicrobiae bacterium]
MNFDFTLPIVGILRGFSTPRVREIIHSCLRGGLRHLEITMGSANTPEQIRLARDIAGDRMSIGAGTVLNIELLEKAVEAGATFIVTPIVNVDVIAECVRRKIPVFPGAYTPTEILNAWELGATMVKVFPADTLGPGYIKAIKAPLPQVKLMPTGGVDLKTISAYKKAGADGFGIGSPLFDRARVEAADWDWVEAQCRALVQAYLSRV